ncbi:major facilitator superfamily transporter [Delphinella strobiligena]|nr:major facilitator superfamily transporter [Delphinella strobiligena]
MTKDSVVSETTTLVASSIRKDDKPLPRAQIFLLCYCRVVEPIAFFSIFPYINQMILATGGVREEDVGFYSGLIESLFSLTQMVLMIPWGRAADRFGRKPILTSSLFGIGITVCFFGLSKAIWQMVLFRCLAGCFSGTVVTVRAMITEHSTQKTQARAFSYLAVASNMGIFLGPLIGGALADPVRQYGGHFTRVRFIRDNPYALPSFVTGFIGLSAALVSFFFIDETLEPARQATPNKPAPTPMTTMELLRSPGVAVVLFLYNYVMLLGMAYTAVAPVFWYTSISLGGLGFTYMLISLFLCIAGLSQAIWLLFVFPPAQNRWGTGGVLHFCGIIWPISFIACPVGNILLRKGFTAAFWVTMPVNAVLGSGASMAFTSVQLALNDISPSPQVLGTLNAVALAMTSGIRAVAPALFSSIFATGVEHHILNGYLVWFILVPMAAGVNVVVRFLPAKADSGMQRDRADEEQHEE